MYCVWGVGGVWKCVGGVGGGSRVVWVVRVVCDVCGVRRVVCVMCVLWVCVWRCVRAFRIHFTAARGLSYSCQYLGSIVVLVLTGALLSEGG